MGPGNHTVSRHVRLTLTLTLLGLKKPLNHLHGLLSVKVDGKIFVKLALVFPWLAAWSKRGSAR